MTSPHLEGVTESGVHWRLGDWREEIGPDATPAASSAADKRRTLLRRRRDVGRHWVRELVTARLGLDWIGFAPDAPGRKPRLLGDAAADASISHGDTTLLVAVVAEGRVGVDVEDDPFDAFARPALVRRMCSDAERATLEPLPDALRRRSLARAWTVKEATLKARGVGLSVDPRAVAVDLEALVAAPRDLAPECSIVHLTRGRALLHRP